jgi:Kef-type K+ transport system membrane component KefB
MIEDLGNTSILLVLGSLFLLGLVADLVGRFTFLPRVTLLLIGGVAIGQAGLSLLPAHFVDTWFPPLTSIALALIGFLLGQQLSLASLRKRGKVVVGISMMKAVGAALVVGLALLVLGVDPIIALLLAGISTATDPAATYDIVHEIDAKGEFAETLLSIVALDDVWGLLIFILMLAGADVLIGTNPVAASVFAGFLNIAGSIALGVALGVPMAYLTGRIRQGEPTLIEALGFVLLGAGIAEWLSMTPILTAMVMGSTVASLAKHHDRPFHAIEGIEWPFMILFFVLAGASLRIDALSLVSGIAITYLIARGIGTYFGARFGGYITEANPTIRRWIGLALFPQAGVAIGMALLASQRFPETASVLLPVTLASTVILETFAPVISRGALRKASQP